MHLIRKIGIYDGIRIVLNTEIRSFSGGVGPRSWSYTMRQNGSPSYRHLHKPYWFVMGPFGKDNQKQDSSYDLKQESYYVFDILKS